MCYRQVRLVETVSRFTSRFAEEPRNVYLGLCMDGFKSIWDV